MDYLWGRAIEVLDGDTFDMKVTRVGRTNDYEYRHRERVRVKGIDAAELDEPGGARSRRRLAAYLGGEHIRIDVHARDRYGRIVGDVAVV